MVPRFILPLALILVTPFVSAQDAGSRVQREANNPLRMIIEAAKIKPRGKSVEPVRPAEPARPADKPVLRAAPETAAPEEAVVAATPPASAPAPAGPPQSTVATVEVQASAPPSAELPAPVAEPLPQAALPPLHLASMVEPVTPRALIGKLRGDVQVHVSFTVNTDGSVTDPTVLSASHRQMAEPVLEAVRQWRYQPIASSRAHEVQLVLRQPD